MAEVRGVIAKELEQIEREKLADLQMTVIKKEAFINELKNGLGEKIKANPNKVKVIKKPLMTRLGIWFKKIFNKF